jgi:hypothetical protein
MLVPTPILAGVFPILFIRIQNPVSEPLGGVPILFVRISNLLSEALGVPPILLGTNPLHRAQPNSRLRSHSVAQVVSSRVALVGGLPDLACHRRHVTGITPSRPGLHQPPKQVPSRAAPAASPHLPVRGPPDLGCHRHHAIGFVQNTRLSQLRSSPERGNQVIGATQATRLTMSEMKMMKLVMIGEKSKNRLTWAKCLRLIPTGKGFLSGRLELAPRSRSKLRSLPVKKRQYGVKDGVF